MIANLENGRKDDLTVRQLMALAFALGRSPVDLLFSLDSPYAPVEVSREDGEAVLAPEWLAYGWFRGDLTLSETRPHYADGRERLFDIFEDPALVQTRNRLLQQRDQLLQREENLAVQLTSAEDPKAFAWVTETADGLRDQLTRVRAELFTLERELRQTGINIDLPHVGPRNP